MRGAAGRERPLAPFSIRTARLVLTPVSYADFSAIVAIKTDPRVYALILGGVRNVVRAAEELSEEIRFWAVHGYGMWSVHDAKNGSFLGLTGFMERPDGRGTALRFAFWPQFQGHGYAREAAAAALRFGHERARLRRIIAVARESNFASRTVLGGIGMREAGRFEQGGHTMILYESRSRPSPGLLPESSSPPFSRAGG